MIQAQCEGLGFRKTMDKGILTARCLQTVIVLVLLGPADSLSGLGARNQDTASRPGVDACHEDASYDCEPSFV